MGYDLHIRRDDGEITPAEVEALPEFRLQDGLTGTNPNTGAEMTVSGPFAIWTDSEYPDGVPFMVGHGGLTVKYRAQNDIELALRIAERLGARVHGDDGEYYTDQPPKRRRFGLF